MKTAAEQFHFRQNMYILMSHGLVSQAQRYTFFNIMKHKKSPGQVVHCFLVIPIFQVSFIRETKLVSCTYVFHSLTWYKGNSVDFL